MKDRERIVVKILSSNDSGQFRQYDYGNNEKNLMIYNSTTPPDYKLDKITAPIALFSSDNDWLATTKVHYKSRVYRNYCIFQRVNNCIA